MILVTIADYITNLLTFDATKVIIGRENATQDIFSQDYIVIDSLAPAENVSDGRDYDYDLEKETLRSYLSGRFTLEFYGDNAYTNAYKLINMQRSQLARDLQKSYSININAVLSVNNLKQIVGSKYFNRYEVEIMIQYIESIDIDTLHIESIDVGYIQN